MQSPLSVAGILYPYFELLDLYGPLEMFGMLAPNAQLFCVAQQRGAVKSAQGPSGWADHDFASAPRIDVLVLPGGAGTVRELENPAMHAFLRERAKQARVVLSVCTGSALLAKTGLLDGRRATSNKRYFALARECGPKTEWLPNARWVEDGTVFTSSGVSAGTDAAVAVIERLLGAEVAERVCTLAEYTRHRDADVDPFAGHLDAGNLAAIKAYAAQLPA